MNWIELNQINLVETEKTSFLINSLFLIMIHEKFIELSYNKIILPVLSNK